MGTHYERKKVRLNRSISWSVRNNTTYFDGMNHTGKRVVVKKKLCTITLLIKEISCATGQVGKTKKDTKFIQKKATYISGNNNDIGDKW